MLLGSGTANAFSAEHVDWLLSDGYSECTTGTSNGWSCTYYLYSYDSNCPEVSVVGTALRDCDLYVEATVQIVPVVNAAGRLVGCTSGPTDTSLANSYADYDSSFNEFDNPDIESIFIGRVHDVFGDGKPGVFDFTAYSASQSNDPAGATWLVKGTVAASCKRGSDTFATAGSGTVDVQQ